MIMKLSKYHLKKCEKFADDQLKGSAKLYAYRGESSKLKMREDIMIPYVYKERESKVKTYQVGDKIHIDGTCIYDKMHKVILNKNEFESWFFGGQVIQDAMPNTTTDEREFLKTGLCCSPIWDNLEE